MSQVEIFKTNVNNKRAALKVAFHLSQALPDYEINFDLEDCDKVLRIKGKWIDVTEVLKNMQQQGYQCELIN